MKNLSSKIFFSGVALAATLVSACSNKADPIEISTPLEVVDEIFIDICSELENFEGTVAKAIASKWKPTSEDLDANLKRLMDITRGQDRAAKQETEYTVFQRSPRSGYVFLVMSRSKSNPNGEEFGCSMYDFNVYDRALDVDSKQIIEKWIGSPPDDMQEMETYLRAKVWDDFKSDSGINHIIVGSMSNHPGLRESAGFSAHSWSASILAGE